MSNKTFTGKMRGAHGQPGALRWEFPVNNPWGEDTGHGVRFADDARGIFGFIPLWFLDDDTEGYIRAEVEDSILREYCRGYGYQPYPTW